MSTPFGFGLGSGDDDPHQGPGPDNPFAALFSGDPNALGAMFTAYEKAKDARKVAEAGVLAGAEFDTGTAMPMTVHEVALAK